VFQFRASATQRSIERSHGVRLAKCDAEDWMRYIVAWILGVPFSVIVLWYLVGHAACGH
jgi:hypothetical protein